MEMIPTGNNRTSESVELMNEVVEDLIRRRAGGERVDDAVVLASHADLMPDLAETLESLRLVEQAEYLVKSDTRSKRDQDDADSSPQARGQLPTASIPGYTILAEIHRGGQGVVYKALQHSTNRIVAIKVMHEGPFGGSRGRARFDREVRILAQLKHPNIVTIHDSGTAAGHHYFVMDYIAGRSLDAHVARAHLTIHQKLALFVEICRAVDAAHSLGVIHRDLKPSNIRITDNGEPRILDFGLAKTDFENPEATPNDYTLTVSGQFVGSLPWASPEQAAGPSGQISIRSDIYSLGVVLYQMVAGQLPYDVSGPLPSALRAIQETVPARASTHRPEIDQDVDIIAMTCLAKDPQLRYQSVGSLVDDLERYLSNQPILARQPSTLYQLRKLAVRHKLPFVLGSTLLLVIIGFAITMGILYGQTTRALNRAQQAERQSEKQRANAEREARNARAINEFLVHDMLAAADPQESLGNELTVADALANAAERVGSALKEQPLVQASVRTAVAQSYMSLGLFAAAEEQLHVANDIRSFELGDADPATLAARVMLVEALLSQNKLEQARILCAETYAAAIHTLDRSHVTVIESSVQQAWFLGSAGERNRSRILFRQALDNARRTLGDEHRLTIKIMSSRSSWAYHLLDFTDAAALFDEALETANMTLGSEHPQTLTAMANVGIALAERRRLAESETLLRRVLEVRRRVLGEHPDTAGAMIDLSVPLIEGGRHDEAEAILREAIDMAVRVAGHDHPTTQDAMHRLGKEMARQDRLDEAIPLFERLLEVSHRVYGADDLRTAAVLDNIGLSYFRLGWYEQAEPNFRRAYEINNNKRKEHDRVKAGCLRRFIESLAAQGKFDEARPLAKKLLEHRRVIAGQTPTTAYWLNTYAWDLLNVQPEDLRDPELALEVAREAYDMIGDDYHYNRYTLALAYQANGQSRPGIEMVRRAIEYIPLQVSDDRTNYEALLVQLLEESGDPVAAEQIYRDTIEQRRREFPAGHSDIGNGVERLAELLMQHGRHEEAEALLWEFFEEGQSVMQEDCRRRPGPCGLLGAALAARKEFAEAEPLLLNAFEEFRSQKYARLDDRRISLERLVNLYQIWEAARPGNGHADMEADYRSMLDAIPVRLSEK